MNRATALQPTVPTAPDSATAVTGQTESALVRLLGRGPEALTDGELLAVLLDEPEPRTARRLLERAGGVAGLPALERLLSFEPHAPETARIRAAVELARRMARETLPERRLLGHPAQVASYLHLRFARAGQEVMGALFVDTRHRLIAEREIFRGAIDRVTVEPRAVLRAALACEATALILFHTHPSGDPAPSHQDLAFTRRMDKAGEAVGVTLSDHLIVAHGGRWMSLRQRGGW